MKSLKSTELLIKIVKLKVMKSLKSRAPHKNCEVESNEESQIHWAPHKNCEVESNEESQIHRAPHKNCEVESNEECQIQSSS